MRKNTTQEIRVSQFVLRLSDNKVNSVCVIRQKVLLYLFQCRILLHCTEAMVEWDSTSLLDRSVFFFVFFSLSLRSSLYHRCSSKMNEEVVYLSQCYCQSGHDLNAHAPSQCCHNVSFLTPVHNAHLIQQTSDLDPFALHAGSPVPLRFPPTRCVPRTSCFPFKQGRGSLS